MNQTSTLDRSLSTWTTRDFMITAVLGVAIGAIFMAYGVLYLALAPLLGQVGVMVLLGF